MKNVFSYTFYQYYQQKNAEIFPAFSLKLHEDWLMSNRLDSLLEAV